MEKHSSFLSTGQLVSVHSVFLRDLYRRPWTMSLLLYS